MSMIMRLGFPECCFKLGYHETVQECVVGSERFKDPELAFLGGKDQQVMHIFSNLFLGMSGNLGHFT